MLASAGGAPAPRRPRLALPSPHLAVLEDPDAFGVETAALSVGGQALRRLVEGLVGEVEGAPVDGYEGLRADVFEDLERLLRCRMASLHDDRRQVGADGYRRHVERPEALADLGEDACIRGVPGK